MADRREDTFSLCLGEVLYLCVYLNGGIKKKTCFEGLKSVDNLPVVDNFIFRGDL